METLKRYWPIALFNAAYVVGFMPFFLARGNYEFLWYTGVLIAIALFVGATIEKTRFPDWLLWLLSVWGLLHVAGGGVRMGDTILYGVMVWPVFDGGGDFVLFKYDQLVHAYGFGVAAVMMHGFLERSMVGARTFWISVVAVLSSMGLSVVNEIVEFIPVVLLPDTNVGGYYNIALDLVFNTLGAVVGVLVYSALHRR
jgi:hypothetical protein